MIKKIMRCDKCGKILDPDDKTQKGIFFEIKKCDLPGWCSLDESFGWYTTWQVCEECIKDILVKKE